MATVKLQIPHPPAPPAGLQKTLTNSHSGMARGSALNSHDAPGAWSKSVAEMVHDANREITQSSHLRGESSREASRLLKKVQEKQDDTNAKLKRRLKETKAVKAKLIAAEQQLVSENRLLTDAVNKTVDMRNRMNNPLNKCSTRMELRSKRPGGENIDDGATKAIETHLGAVQRHIAELDKFVATGRLQVATNDKNIATLRSDIAAKSKAIEVDGECLKYHELGVEVPETQGDGPHGTVIDLRIPEMPTPGNGGYQISKSNTNPDLWKQVSSFNIDSGRTNSNTSRELRNKLLNVVKRTHEQHRIESQQSSEAIQRKMRQTQGHMKLASTELRKLEKELADLESQRTSVMRSLMDKREPLELAKRRLVNRQNRPKNELVRDEVEVSLEEEFERLVESMQSLENKSEQINREIARLRAAYNKLKGDFNRKSDALAVDQRCYDLDEMSAYSVSSTPNLRKMGGRPPAVGNFRAYHTQTPVSVTPDESANGSRFPPLPRSPRNGGSESYSAAPYTARSGSVTPRQSSPPRAMTPR